MNEKERIAMRVAKELKDGDVVNLGIGVPTLAANYLPEGVHITLQSENGILGMGVAADDSNRDENIINAGGGTVTVNPGASFFDTATSFAIIRGGHVNISVLGGLQVDEKGNLASHIVPGKMASGMGGAMDLVVGSRRVVVAMTHTAKGTPKILKELTLPPTALGKVNMIITEMAVMEVTPAGLVLKEVMEGFTVEEVQAATGATLIIDENTKTFTA